MPSVAPCPYCNALTPAEAVGVRVRCVRCGESFVPSRLEETRAAPLRAEAPAGLPRRRRVWWRAVGLVVIVAALGIILWWQGFFHSSQEATVEGPRMRSSPAEMPGLGYLPEECDVVLGLHVPPLLERLGTETDPDPVPAIIRVGLPRPLVEIMDRASGVGLRGVEQMCVGVKLGQVPPQVVMVTHTAQPLDLDRLARARKATTVKRGERTIYVVRGEHPPDVFWWSPAPRVLIGTIYIRDYDDVPDTPLPGIGHFREPLTRLIRESTAADAIFWMAAWSDRWARHIRPIIQFPGTMYSGRSDLIRPAERLRAFVVSIPSDGERPVDVAIALATPEAAEDLYQVYLGRFQNEPVEVARDAETVRIRTTCEPNRIGSMLGRLIGDP